MSKRALTERQSRWVDVLTPLDFVIRYRKGSENAAADALSRRDQDQPSSPDDERTLGRFLQMIPDSAIPDDPAMRSRLETQAKAPRVFCLQATGAVAEGGSPEP